MMPGTGWALALFAGIGFWALFGRGQDAGAHWLIPQDEPLLTDFESAAEEF